MSNSNVGPTYVSGSLKGRAHIYDYGANSVVRAGEIDVANASQVDIRSCQEVKGQAEIEAIASSFSKASMKVRDRCGIERELKITSVDTRTVVIVFTSDDNETKAFEERHRLRNRIEPGARRAHFCTKTEASKQHEGSNALAMTKPRNDAPTHAHFPDA